MTEWPIHARFDGPIVIIGYGSIGRGALPLILRHIACDRNKITVIDPEDTHRDRLDREGIAFINKGLTPENYREILTPLLTVGPGRGFLVNLSVDVSSLAMIDLCKDLDAYSIDTVIEPWLGFYSDKNVTNAGRTNYALREALLALRRRRPGGPTAVSCCGANPGMVSWLTKQALLHLAVDHGIKTDVPTEREGWAALMRRLGIKGIHIAERDTQHSKTPKPRNTFINTWSVDGFIAEGLQPAELGWGSHEKTLPPEGKRHEAGCGAGIYLERPGAGTRVRTWTPTGASQLGFLITHNEAISIADYFTLREGDKVVYRPTCHYAYHPCDDAVLSLYEMAGRQWQPQDTWVVLDEKEIFDGVHELGVLLYGHNRNAYWYGSQLSIEEARRKAPYQNATGLQVSSAVLAGMVWALENPDSGIVEADEIDFARCLEVQRPYLGPVIGVYTDWTPLTDRDGGLFPDEVDEADPWQFSNVLFRDSL